VFTQTLEKSPLLTLLWNFFGQRGFGLAIYVASKPVKLFYSLDLEEQI